MATLGEADLLPYQAEGVDAIVNRRRLYLGDDPGLGKTAQVIIACANLPDRMLDKGVLIICPASLRLNWRAEWEKWGGPECELHIMSYQEATKDAQGKPPRKGRERVGIKERHWGLVCMDEAHALKSTKSQRGRALIFNIWKELKDAAEPELGEIFVRSEGVEGDRMVLMSGTPVLNKPVDIFPLIRHLDRKTWPSKSKFEQRYCDAHVDNFGRWNTDGSSNLSELKEKLTGPGLLLRRMKKDVLKDLPAKRRQIIPVTGRVGDTRKIQSILADIVSEEPTLTDSDADLKWAVTALGELSSTKMGQVAELRQKLGIAKLEPALDYIMEQHKLGVLPEKLVIFAHHREVIEVLTKSLNQNGISAKKYYGGMSDDEKDQVVREFQTGSLQVFVGSIMAAGVGLTLTAADTAIILEPSYVPAENIQAEDRLHRIGAVNPVLIQYLVLANSLDARIMTVVTQKMEMISEILS